MSRLFSGSYGRDAWREWNSACNISPMIEGCLTPDGYTDALHRWVVSGTVRHQEVPRHPITLVLTDLIRGQEPNRRAVRFVHAAAAMHGLLALQPSPEGQLWLDDDTADAELVGAWLHHVGAYLTASDTRESDTEQIGGAWIAAGAGAKMPVQGPPPRPTLYRPRLSGRGPQLAQLTQHVARATPEIEGVARWRSPSTRSETRWPSPSSGMAADQR